MKSALTDLFDLLEQQHECTISQEQKEAIDRAAPWAKRLGGAGGQSGGV